MTQEQIMEIAALVAKMLTGGNIVDAAADAKTELRDRDAERVEADPSGFIIQERKRWPVPEDEAGACRYLERRADPGFSRVSDADRAAVIAYCTAQYPDSSRVKGLALLAEDAMSR